MKWWIPLFIKALGRIEEESMDVRQPLKPIGADYPNGTHTQAVDKG